MARASRPAEWGRTIEHPNDAWLAGQKPEPVLDPDLPIIDPHHHFWERRGEAPGNRYLLDELLATGIVGYADLTLGARVEPVLEAHWAARRSKRATMS